MARIVPENSILIPENAKKVFKGAIFDVYQWKQQMFDGSSATFEMLKRPDTVVFLAIKDDKVIFIREQQPNRGEYTRLPGGRVDEGEEWLAAVKRECREELGMEFNSWRLIDVRQPVAKIEWFVAVYIATDCVAEVEASHDPGEKITVLPMSFDGAKEYSLSTTDPLNENTRGLFRRTNSLEDLKKLPLFTGKEVG